MPHALQLMSTGTDNERCNLPAAGAVIQGGEIICQCWKCINKIIKILYLGDWFESPQCQSDPLSDNGRLADPGVENTVKSEFLRQPFVS